METAVSNLSEPAEHRQASRTHLFVTATLCWDEGSAPARTRNMSVRGALIEAEALPKPGSRIVLKRGSLEAGGHVAWAASGQAGLAFGSAVRVPDWMVRRTNAHQDRVDEIVASLRSATAEEQPAALADEHLHSAGLRPELSLLRDDLSKLGDALATDIILVATHPEIQLLDISLQRIDRIIRALN